MTSSRKSQKEKKDASAQQPSTREVQCTMSRPRRREGGERERRWGGWWWWESRAEADKQQEQQQEVCSLLCLCCSDARAGPRSRSKMMTGAHRRFASSGPLEPPLAGWRADGLAIGILPSSESEVTTAHGSRLEVRLERLESYRFFLLYYLPTGTD